MVEWDVKRTPILMDELINQSLISSFNNFELERYIKRHYKPYRIIHNLCKKPWLGGLTDTIRINKDTLACKVCGTEVPKDVAENLKRLRDFSNKLEVLGDIKL